jgi:hypothetical protein
LAKSIFFKKNKNKNKNKNNVGRFASDRGVCGAVLCGYEHWQSERGGAATLCGYQERAVRGISTDSNFRSWKSCPETTTGENGVKLLQE